jgi:hypothetical protein
MRFISSAYDPLFTYIQVQNNQRNRHCCGSGIQCLFDPGIRDGEKSESGTTIPDLIFKSLQTIFWVKIHKFFVADPDPVLFQPWIDLGWKNPDPHYWARIIYSIQQVQYIVCLADQTKHRMSTVN